MSGDMVIRCLELLCACSLLLQTLEYWRIADSTDPEGVWSWPVQRADIPDSAVWIKRFLDGAFRPQNYRAMLVLRGLGALWLAWFGASLGLACGLFICQLLLLVRWRGAFNGGSDFMTLGCLSGILLAGDDAVVGSQHGLGGGFGLYRPSHLEFLLCIGLGETSPRGVAKRASADGFPQQWLVWAFAAR